MDDKGKPHCPVVGIGKSKMSTSKKVDKDSSRVAEYS